MRRKRLGLLEPQIIYRLSTMPPLSHLASTQQNNTYHYNNNNNSNNNDMLDFGSDDVVFEDNVNAPPDGDTNATAANDDIELNPFRRNVPLPPNLVFQVHMENVITSHSVRSSSSYSGLIKRNATSSAATCHVA